jgi:hypothetical protein
LVCSVRPWSW